MVTRVMAVQDGDSPGQAETPPANFSESSRTRSSSWVPTTSNTCWLTICHGGEPVTVSEPPRVPECRDPFDQPFLELALLGEADALVTGDQDLLALAPEFPVPIVTARAIRRRLAESESPSRYGER